MFIFSLNNFSEIEAKNKQALKPFRSCCWRAFFSGAARRLLIMPLFVCVRSVKMPANTGHIKSHQSPGHG
ncbi:hypothetical protein FNN91_23500 [Salmonella enterica subsp. salamae]|nr:hypothetical protein [Salmonella enterica subsp. salamae]